ncbi:MAG: flagellar biosynthesis protein FlhB [Alphaproteobacteria bacterium]|nr:flagellar biosynthesis protein FlhB [Alphaproteobacteria bacterium]
MAEGEQDDEQKTEDPTQKRLDDAVQKGNIPNSKEVGSFFMVLALAITVAWFAPMMLRSAGALLSPFISDADSMPTDPKGLGDLLRHVVFGGMAIIAGPLVAAIVAALAGGMLQNGLVISGESIVPKLSKISPMAGFGRIFSMRSLVEFFKNILKISIVGYVAFVVVYPDLPQLNKLPDMTTEAMLALLLIMAKHLVIGVAIAMFFIAIFDVVYQRLKYIKSLRMTKQEIKDEYKQSEGDPMIKGRLRRLRMERAKNRMMAEVPTADVVITNPTHFAVALTYDTGKMQAPLVVAKGQDLIALKIREIAEANKVPIVENPPLARALFSSAELNEEIPQVHYEAVAKVISYVYQLKGKKFNK